MTVTEPTAFGGGIHTEPESGADAAWQRPDPSWAIASTDAGGDKPGGDKPKVPSDKAAMRIHRHGP